MPKGQTGSCLDFCIAPVILSSTLSLPCPHHSHAGRYCPGSVRILPKYHSSRVALKYLVLNLLIHDSSTSESVHCFYDEYYSPLCPSHAHIILCYPYPACYSRIYQGLRFSHQIFCMPTSSSCCDIFDQVVYAYAIAENRSQPHKLSLSSLISNPSHTTLEIAMTKAVAISASAVVK